MSYVNRGVLRTLVALLCALCAPHSAFPQQWHTTTASWYGKAYHGRVTASGARFNMRRMTAAARDVPLGSAIVVCRGEKCVRVLVNDRMPAKSKRGLDLSRAAADALGMVEAGVSEVRYRISTSEGERK